MSWVGRACLSTTRTRSPSPTTAAAVAPAHHGGACDASAPPPPPAAATAAAAAAAVGAANAPSQVGMYVCSVCGWRCEEKGVRGGGGEEREGPRHGFWIHLWGVVTIPTNLPPLQQLIHMHTHTIHTHTLPLPPPITHTHTHHHQITTTIKTGAASNRSCRISS
jgi:hypothetical protein